MNDELQLKMRQVSRSFADVEATVILDYTKHHPQDDADFKKLLSDFNSVGYGLMRLSVDMDIMMKRVEDTLSSNKVK